MYSIFLLDADQTIFDFNKSEYLAIKNLFSSYNLQFKKEIYDDYHQINDSLWKRHERAEISKQDIFDLRFKMLFKKYNILGEFSDINERYFNNLANGHYLIDGAVKLLKFLKTKGDIYIATNGRTVIQKNRIKLAKIGKYLSGVFISDEIGFGKPNIQFFEYIENNIQNFKKENCIIIGDSLSSDISGGINFGIDTMWVNFEEKNKDNLNITYSCKNLYEAIEILKKKG